MTGWISGPGPSLYTLAKGSHNPKQVFSGPHSLCGKERADLCAYIHVGLRAKVLGSDRWTGPEKLSYRRATLGLTFVLV